MLPCEVGVVAVLYILYMFRMFHIAHLKILNELVKGPSIIFLQLATFLSVCVVDGRQNLWQPQMLGIGQQLDAVATGGMGVQVPGNRQSTLFGRATGLSFAMSVPLSFAASVPNGAPASATPTQSMLSYSASRGGFAGFGGSAPQESLFGAVAVGTSAQESHSHTSSLFSFSREGRDAGFGLCDEQRLAPASGAFGSGGGGDGSALGGTPQTMSFFGSSFGSVGGSFDAVSQGPPSTPSGFGFVSGGFGDAQEKSAQFSIAPITAGLLSCEGADAPPGPEDPLVQIARLQEFNGSFKINQR